MRINKLFITLGMMIAFVLFYEFAAHADVSNEATKVTLSMPVQIPGQVLPAGTYWFQRADSNEPQIIQIFTADRSSLVATVLTASAERPEPADETVITLAEPTSSRPVLVKWFYPGETIGHEFLYSKQREREIAQAHQATFVGNELTSLGESSGE
jgi:S-formylglutathione hydrolase FrmB